MLYKIEVTETLPEDWQVGRGDLQKVIHRQFLPIDGSATHVVQQDNLEVRLTITTEEYLTQLMKQEFGKEVEVRITKCSL